ncbi:MAG: hypothetical protein L0Z62_49265 [Gemmataceae bacterium]|nr:hypothetical protein [Gemmataceae bacterium]
MFDPRKHNYYRKLIELFEQSKHSAELLQEVDIYHDDWCDIYRGGYCNCDPEVELRRPPERN